MKFYVMFFYVGDDKTVKDIIRYCTNNPNNLDFGDKLDISYKKLEYGFSSVSIAIEKNDYERLLDFKLTAELINDLNFDDIEEDF